MAKHEYRIIASNVMPALKSVGGIVPQRSIIPILSDIAISCKGNTMIVEASDNETWLKVKCAISENVSNTEHAFCVNAKDFIKAVANLGDMEATIVVDDEKNKMVCTYASGHFSMPCESVREFPHPNAVVSDDSPSIIIGAKNLAAAIDATFFATANDELRPILNGIHFDFLEDGMVSVATDAQRLVRYKDDGVKLDANDGKKMSFTLHKKPASVLLSILGTDDVRLSFNDTCVSVSNSNFKMDARLSEGKYPDYTRVIPEARTRVTRIFTNELHTSIQRVMTMGNTNTMLVVMSFNNDGKVTLSAEDFDFDRSAVENVPFDYYSGEPIKIGFKGSSLCEVIKNIRSDKVVVEMTDPTKAAVFYPDEDGGRDTYLSLLMPMVIANQ